MAFHHVALATRDLEATHRFYTEAMGFPLAKVVVGPATGNPDGWARHVFYDTGDGGLMAFWELHDPQIQTVPTAISTDLGLPPWVNHLAFAATPEQLPQCRDRWLAFGLDVHEVDHHFCLSLYTTDPNGILVEWCADTRPLDDRDRQAAQALLFDPAPAMDPAPIIRFHPAIRPARREPT